MGDVMKTVILYLKYLGIFMLFIIGMGLISSLISLLGINSVLVSKIAIILTAISFFIVSALASNKTSDKGYILGIKMGGIFVLFLVLVNLIIFRSSFNLDRFIYYIILICSSILGGSFGKNIKIKKLAR